MYGNNGRGGGGGPAWSYGVAGVGRGGGGGGGDGGGEEETEKEQEFEKLPVYVPAGAFVPRPPFDFNNCAVKAAVSLVLGGAMGMVFGPLFSGNAAAVAPVDEAKKKVKWTVTMKEGAKEMGKSSWRMGKTFAVVGLVFASSECVIEKVRGKHDLYNSVGAGCVSGAILGAPAGPQAAAIGCAGFAAFSAAFDWLLGGEDPRKKMEVDDDMDELPMKVLRHELGEDFDLQDLSDEELENLVGLKLEDLDLSDLDDMEAGDEDQLDHLAAKVSHKEL